MSKEGKECKYCVGIFKDGYQILMEHQVPFGNAILAVEVGLDVDKGTLYSDFTEFVEGEVKINFCPICGRRLRK